MKAIYWQFTESLPLKFCQEVIDYAKTQSSSLGLTGDQKENSKKNNKKRKSKVIWLEEDWIYKILCPYVSHANSSLNLNYKINTTETPQFTIYEVGQYYGWHQDHWPEPYPSNHNSIRLRNKSRKISSTVALNSKGEYEGGDLQLAVDKPDSPKREIISPDLNKAGSMIVFPSPTWHRVTPVTKGTRYSLVMWSVGAPLQ
jgi:PKHD-type hydroxylase